MPKEAWSYMLSYELMKRTKDDIWDTNQILMRKIPGVGSHFKEAIKRRDLEHRKLYFSPLMWLSVAMQCICTALSQSSMIIKKYEL